MDTPPATDDMAAQEAPARGYQPDLKGPLMAGEKSSYDIREEHAKVDPGYVGKASVGRPSCAVRPTVTISLCLTMPTVDGEVRILKPTSTCPSPLRIVTFDIGPAMNFPCLGTFHKLRSKDQIDEEYGSMPLTGSIETWCDHRKWIFEDIRGEVLSLLTDLAATIHVGPQSDANSLISRRFNDEEVSSAIIYYFRLVASAFLKANQDFIPDGVGNFCKDMLEPLNTEIGNLGITILIDVLMNPMCIAVEIVYLDRSGTHANSHLIRAEDDNGIPINPAGPIV
ncbi:hypothetical protein V502_01933, partial [Pseudogymnoascus sp. VKM F-4520 (FW-2644)]